jgi:hypothetical protein
VTKTGGKLLFVAGIDREYTRGDNQLRRIVVMPNGRPFEWGRAAVHFIFGAALGAFVGLSVCARFLSDSA